MTLNHALEAEDWIRELIAQGLNTKKIKERFINEYAPGLEESLKSNEEWLRNEFEALINNEKQAIKNGLEGFIKLFYDEEKLDLSEINFDTDFIYAFGAAKPGEENTSIKINVGQIYRKAKIADDDFDKYFITELYCTIGHELGHKIKTKLDPKFKGDGSYHNETLAESIGLLFLRFMEMDDGLIKNNWTVQAEYVNNNKDVLNVIGDVYNKLCWGSDYPLVCNLCLARGMLAGFQDPNKIYVGRFYSNNKIEEILELPKGTIDKNLSIIKATKL